jgi:hypothetical protein
MRPAIASPLKEAATSRGAGDGNVAAPGQPARAPVYAGQRQVHTRKDPFRIVADLVDIGLVDGRPQARIAVLALRDRAQRIAALHFIYAATLLCLHRRPHPESHDTQSKAHL